MDIASHKIHELRQRLASLEDEFKDWTELSEVEKSFEKHHTQIRRLTSHLAGSCEELAASLKQLEAEADTLAQGQALQKEILAVHRIWDFFRSKLALRGVERFGEYLKAADELAWECYLPAMEKIARHHIPSEEIKQPPLVFFNGGANPYSMARKLAFWPERVLRDEITKAKFLKILESLPVPLIGIPWFQIRHLPDALSIGHEVGHIVMSDLRLTDRVKELLEAGMKSGDVHEKRRGAWRAWLNEIFADLYGTLAAGPAFVESLINNLAGDKITVTGDCRTRSAWGKYPPAFLRVLLNLEALRAQDFRDESERLKRYWEDTYDSHAMREFEPDVFFVVKALLTSPYPEFGGAPLTGVISFSTDQFNSARADCESLLDGDPPAAAPDIRTVFAASLLAFSSDPVRYDTHNAHQLALDFIVKRIQTGTRDGDDEATLEALDKFDKQRGRDLIKLLRNIKTEG